MCQRRAAGVRPMKAHKSRTRRGHSAGAAVAASGIDARRAAHMQLGTREIMTENGLDRVTVNDSESPLAWLARRKGRDGRTMIDSIEFMAGERLRADFTRAHLSPRVTSSWSGLARGRNCGGGDAGSMTDMVIAARQRVQLALDACGPEFSGVLMDVCCFLHGLEDVERAHGWPARSAKVVLQLALDRLARHYGLQRPAHHAPIRTWLAEDASFTA